VDTLSRAAACLTGVRDFAPFGAPPKAGGVTIRDVKRAAWRLDGDELVFEVTANAFLYHMVRRLVHVQVAIGQGKLTQDDLLRQLESDIQLLPPGLAPPQGLSLVEVEYPADIHPADIYILD
jgi:tRNA pseudouridine38-40 synthase